MVSPRPLAEKEHAKEAGLSYASDHRPGITRHLAGKEFIYSSAAGARITDAAVLSRIRSLAIPPAWTDVWICPSDKGHLQATGRDARKRKQYRYHPLWREYRDGNKFQHMVAFARALPKIRRTVRRDLKKPGMPREKVLAAVLKLLETTLIRVGNDEYARTNRSYGLTTLHNKHVKISGDNILFNFRGKSGKVHGIRLKDREMARIVKRCQHMPGQELFAYEDAEGKLHDIGSQDVNEYLRAITGSDFTAKDYRTWAGTVLAAIALREFEDVASQAQAKKNVIVAVESVARMLGNTPSVCRKCYVHPTILDSYFEGLTIATLTKKVAVKIDKSLSALKPEEASVLVLLQRRLKDNRRRLSASGKT
ncbi:DNA topoisomerase-1 [Prosthecobacter fusiformis]|uniref:DNA topoisomerase n=2 Tax=Prosthecobacter fusiformis TaxID=48464 RepID=A0A4R7S4S8_9BACT|nr:DNA topoisomerase-1 [Prosthecobacter fusiformis]